MQASFEISKYIHLMDFTPLFLAMLMNFFLFSIEEFVLSITTLGLSFRYKASPKSFKDFAGEPNVSLFILK
jgi:hypothetical protein